MEIRIYVKHVYGREVFYPACPNAELFAQIAKTRTLSKRTIQLIRELGFKVFRQDLHMSEREFYNS